MLDELMATGMDRQDMLDVFINTQEEDFLEALHSVFREAVNARGAKTQQWFNVFLVDGVDWSPSRIPCALTHRCL